jgi:hypothetical protein
VIREMEDPYREEYLTKLSYVEIEFMLNTLENFFSEYLIEENEDITWYNHLEKFEKKLKKLTEK